MILFKACTRCGGDVEAAFPEDIFCVQCGHRPDVALPSDRMLPQASDGDSIRMRVPDVEVVKDRGLKEHPTGEIAPLGGSSSASPCPRCGSPELVRLDRLRRRDNVCYRCRPCGHIFSPARGSDAEDVRTG